MSQTLSTTAANKSEILLEAGTNEVEIFEFTIGEQCYGVNVAKVNQIIQRDQLTITRADLPPPGVIGTITFRGKPTMTIDLREILNIHSDEPEASRSLMLVTQFNEQVVAFAIDAAERIHRVSWKSFEPINNSFSQENPYVNGIIRLEEKLILVLDLEYILTLVNPNFGLKLSHSSSIDEIEAKFKPRQDIKILFAEDSPMIRRMVKTQLESVGLTNLTLASNGMEALQIINQYVEDAKETDTPMSDHVDLILTDIEMPVMDGLTLCRNIKKELQMKTPVVVFSSLINSQMVAKCKSVGANGWGSKPKVDLVVEIIDRLVVNGEDELGDLNMG